MASVLVSHAAPVDIDGQAINLATLRDAVAACMARATAGRGFTFFTFNLDHVVKRRADATFRACYRRATFVTADGAPIVWLAGRQGRQLDRVTGADIVLPLCEAAARAGTPVALYGSSESALARAAAQLRALYPALRIAFMEAPPAGFDPQSAAADEAGRRIAASGARLCFVALGAPKQEVFSDRMFARHPDVGFLGIGAALDFIAGEQRRAPAFFQRNGLEWAWRLATNPRRLFQRYAMCATTLASLVLVPRSPDLAPRA